MPSLEQTTPIDPFDFDQPSGGPDWTALPQESGEPVAGPKPPATSRRRPGAKAKRKAERARQEEPAAMLFGDEEEDPEAPADEADEAAWECAGPPQGLPCPLCGRPMAAQYDTVSDEPFWRCDDCWCSFALDGGTPTIDFTAAEWPSDEPRRARKRGKKKPKPAKPARPPS